MQHICWFTRMVSFSPAVWRHTLCRILISSIRLLGRHQAHALLALERQPGAHRTYVRNPNKDSLKNHKLKHKVMSRNSNNIKMPTRDFDKNLHLMTVALMLASFPNECVLTFLMAVSGSWPSRRGRLMDSFDSSPGSWRSSLICCRAMPKVPDRIKVLQIHDLFTKCSDLIVENVFEVCHLVNKWKP